MTKKRKALPTVDHIQPDSLSREIVAERDTVMKALPPVVRMLGTIVGPNIEIVLHDLMRPEHSIVAIANGHISNRTVGSSIIAGPKGDKAFVETKKQLTERGEAEHSIIDNYATETDGGLRLRSSTVVFRDANGDPFAALCLNADMTMFQAAHHWLGQFLAPLAQQDEGVAAPRPAMDTLMAEIIDEAVRRLGKPVSLMNKEEKTQAVQAMLKRGLFIVKGGVERAAAALGVSRFTVYNYLEAIRQRDGDGAETAPSTPEPAPAASKAKPRAAKAGPAPAARRKSS
ncbi:PAS domain-containing protein [Mitsuaria sp. GD03876]|uniref:helix-turn-helix transcriptional regulator n=1 Tax=Mitsuaria sp. GD03876 TaxID=2975399 RepID=UPI00244CBAA8|nr:PAS domain-containing protein [Mitsuaria sp. GD03876]MDH0867341.1 PAS domain-containing protein [Mitsuaria sp. GD03876]